MLGIFKPRRQDILISQIEAVYLRDIAKIQKSSFDNPWEDGAIAEMLKGNGMAGLIARTSKNKADGVSAFMIYRNVASECEIITIACAPKLRRSGAARALMEEFIRICLADRLSEIFLEVDEANKPALNLYNSLGFKKVGERQAYYGRDVTNADTGRSGGNAFIMRLDLKA